MAQMQRVETGKDSVKQRVSDAGGRPAWTSPRPTGWWRTSAGTT